MEEKQLGFLDKTLVSIEKKELAVEEKLKALQNTYPDIFEQIEAIKKASDEVKKLKEAVKEELIKNKDFDIHQVGDLEVSVSAVAKVKVEDIDKVPDEYKSYQMVADVEKAKEQLKLLHTLPAGFIDKSFYKLNWKKGSK